MLGFTAPFGPAQPFCSLQAGLSVRSAFRRSAAGWTAVCSCRSSRRPAPRRDSQAGFTSCVSARISAAAALCLRFGKRRGPGGSFACHMKPLVNLGEEHRAVPSLGGPFVGRRIWKRSRRHRRTRGAALHLRTGSCRTPAGRRRPFLESVG